ncbi:hypothetical protein UFOVP45_9 [uncultured Caudovirales phage]|uniref:Uncharacterized protein n=1 Tax=uncultured Caudovirales phage TaxID=2100421 RepID=A0A6J5KN09_9CAUD|nr:hypothetical protein UFOVP45_9 [uncultured Caudovirales phage]
MAVCANCASDAIYTYQITEEFSQNFCQRHLPKFLVSQKNMGLLPLKEDAPVVDEVPTKSSKKKTTPAVEEPAAETTPAE